MSQVKCRLDANDVVATWGTGWGGIWVSVTSQTYPHQRSVASTAVIIENLRTFPCDVVPPLASCDSPFKQRSQHIYQSTASYCSGTKESATLGGGLVPSGCRWVPLLTRRLELLGWQSQPHGTAPACGGARLLWALGSLRALEPQLRKVQPWLVDLLWKWWR